MADGFAIGPADIAVFSGDDGGYPGLRAADALADLDLREPCGADFGNQVLPVHATIITITFIQVNANMIRFGLKICHDYI